jgi:hypothetical protein
MHRGHDHDHLNGAGGGHASPRAGLGHNHAGAPAAQWQTPHLDKAASADAASSEQQADLDQVERAFVDGFAAAPDPTSFLRLASIPFELTGADGTKLVLLRVEIDFVADVGSVMPHLGGASFRYDPLPAKMVAKRQRLSFVYFDGQQPRALSFAEVRSLSSRATQSDCSQGPK